MRVQGLAVLCPVDMGEISCSGVTSECYRIIIWTEREKNVKIIEEAVASISKLEAKIVKCQVPSARSSDVK